MCNVEYEAVTTLMRGQAAHVTVLDGCKDTIPFSIEDSLTHPSS